MTLCGEKATIQKNVLRMLLKSRSMLADSLAVVGHSWDLDQKRHGTRHVLREWDRTAAMMILQLVTESGHPVFRASSAFE